MIEPQTGGSVADFDDWQRLSAWSMVQFSVRAITQHIRTAIFAVPATLGALRSDRVVLAWIVPGVIVVLVILSAVLNFVFYRFRLGQSSIQVRQGALRKKHLELDFERIQNISIEEPIYYRPLGLVTLKIDGAGSSGEEVRIMAIRRASAAAMRAYIRDKKEGAAPRHEATAGESAAGPASADGTLYFTRSLGDLIVHGLTNNRAFIAIAGIFAFLSQANITPADIVARLGIDFDVIVAGMSMVRLTLLFVLSFVLVVGLFALLSVVVSVFSYYGYSLYRTDTGLVVKRGLLTRHEVQVRKSRIQSIALRQDWLDYLLGRRNILLEPITHRPNPGSEGSAGLGKRILVPSVRLHETATVTDEILPLRLERLQFRAASFRLFKKYALIFSGVYFAATAAWFFMAAPVWVLVAVLTLWPAHMFLLYMGWKRKGIAVDGDIIVVRSGTIGINYSIFYVHKLQDVSHIQSILMRRRQLSTLVFHTASTTARMPYIDTRFARNIVDYGVYRVEADGLSWM